MKLLLSNTNILFFQRYVPKGNPSGINISYTCDICGSMIYEFGYRCSEGCDYDICFDCIGISSM